MRRHSQLTKLLALTIATAALFPIPIYASNSLTPSITVAPSIVEINAEAGKALKKKIEVINNTSLATPVDLQVYNYNRDEKGRAVFSEGQSESDPASWIQFDKYSEILIDRESAIFTADIKIPENTPAGTYFAAFIFRPVMPPDFYSPHSSRVVPYIAAIAIINVIQEGEAPMPGFLQIKSFKTDTLHLSLPATLTLEFANLENFYRSFNGNINVYNSSGEFIKSLKQGPTSILPKQDLIVEKELINLKPGRYVATFTTDVGTSEDSASFQFWYIPFSYIRGLLFGILIILLLIYVSTKFKKVLRAGQILIRG